MLLCPSLHKAPAPYHFPMDEKADTLSYADSAIYIHHKEHGLFQEFTRLRNRNSYNYAKEFSFTTDTRVTRNSSLQKKGVEIGDYMEGQRDSAHSNCCVLPHHSTATHFLNLPVLSCFLIHLTFSFMTLIHITTHFSDHPVLSFSMIRLSTTHHSVQPIIMQFVYATSYPMTQLSLE